LTLIGITWDFTQERWRKWCTRQGSVATRKHTIVGQKYFKGGQTSVCGEQKYTKYNKININTENFKGGKIAARGTFDLLALLGYGPETMKYGLETQTWSVNSAAQHGALSKFQRRKGKRLLYDYQ